MSETNTVSPLRQRMIEDMAARKLSPHTQRSHIHSCKRFAAFARYGNARRRSEATLSALALSAADLSAAALSVTSLSAAAL